MTADFPSAGADAAGHGNGVLHLRPGKEGGIYCEGGSKEGVLLGYVWVKAYTGRVQTGLFEQPLDATAEQVLMYLFAGRPVHLGPSKGLNSQPLKSVTFRSK